MLPTDNLDYVLKFVPSHSSLSRPVTLLLLHGTGGDESSLLAIGNELWPGAALLGLRWKVLENSIPDSFRGFTEPSIGNATSRTEGLAQFIRAASERYRFSMRQLIVVGYSDGANLAASLILLHPHYLAGAVLFRPMVPLAPGIIRNFSNLSIFISAALQDPLIPAGQAEELAAIFQSGGADVTINWHNGGRELGEDEIQAAKNWLQGEKIRNKIAA
jgi:predicted esterase